MKHTRFTLPGCSVAFRSLTVLAAALFLWVVRPSRNARTATIRRSRGTRPSPVRYGSGPACSSPPRATKTTASRDAHSRAARSAMAVSTGARSLADALMARSTPAAAARSCSSAASRASEAARSASHSAMLRAGGA